MSPKFAAFWSALALSIIAIALAFLAVQHANQTGAWAGMAVTSLAALGAWLTFVLMCNRQHNARQLHRLERKIDGLRKEVAAREGFQDVRCQNCALRRPDLRVITTS